MKLTNSAKKELEYVLSDLNKAIKFINSDNIVIATTLLPNNQSYYKGDKGITPLAKFVGSELNYLMNAKEKIQRIVEKGSI